MVIIQVYMKARVSASALAAVASLVIPARLVQGQSHESHSDTSKRVSLAAQAIGVMTRQSPALGGRAFTEGYITQPTLMAHARAWSNILTVQAMVSLEGFTLERGELNPGIVGEGYIDRRHPHTYLHELTGTVQHRVGRARASLTIGKGFAPFGTDDPMARPFVKYPINHHLAQILERIVAIAAVRAGPFVVEAGAFNGDEPEGPGDAPNAERLWDSWAGRATLLPFAGGELQASFASVRSPEIAAGGGTDGRKWSVSARFSGNNGRRYALAEWAPDGDKRYAFIGEEGPGSVGSFSSGDIHVVDVSDLSAPREVAFYRLAAAGTHNFSVDESRGLLYAAFYNGGVRVLDISGDLSSCSAAQRSIDGRCDLGRMGREVASGLSGEGQVYIWGVHLVGGILYASDMLNGLWALREFTLPD